MNHPLLKSLRSFDFSRVKTPFFIMDLSIVEQQYRQIEETFGGAAIFYPAKANPHPAVISRLNQQGCCFLVSSWEELLSLKVSKSRIMVYNPSFERSDFLKLLQQGCRRFILDSTEQAAEFAASGRAKGLTILVRIRPAQKPTGNPYQNDGLGIPGREAEALLRMLSKAYPDAILGIHTHIASQNIHLASWKSAVEEMVGLATRLKREGIALKILDIGGGFPIQYDSKVPSVSQISNALSRPLLSARKLGLVLFIEPGRFLVAPAAALLCTILLVKGNTLFVDDSVYNAYLDTLIAGVELPAELIGEHKPGQRQYVIRGKSPCSLDTFGKVTLPLASKGDVICLLQAGAYALSSDFMSMRKACTIVLEGRQ